MITVMYPVYKNHTVSTHCPGCDGALSSYTSQVVANTGTVGTLIVNEHHQFAGKGYNRILYMLLRCGGCGMGGLAVIHDSGGQPNDGTLESFYPACINSASIPSTTPKEIQAEFREAEVCASHGAWRASSAMLRSVLEKTLKLNGYTQGSLKSKIDEAATDGVLTEARKNRAQQEIRVLGNDILHDAWREVTAEEYALAHHYAQRILEDFYDSRADVETILTAKKRIPVTP